MESAMRTLQITLPVGDASFLRRQSRNMGWHVTTVRTPRKLNPKVKMTEEEFRAKLVYSSSQLAEGKVITMRPEETAEQFINRMLCI